ncbi:hypothetical protein [Enhygromyxa salina]|uniref:hypothetical protein n=1 Tax=Enhygromyxa salina TaxID=215803 RepID=UPI0011B1DB48|nr:hypothetical protein [Enhygromyxa salina]
MNRLCSGVLIAVVLTACSQDSASDAGGQAGQARADQNGQKGSVEGLEVSGPLSDDEGVALGQVKATPLINLNALVNKTVEEVDAVLGPPKDVGTDRISCVRFLPERVFFACEQEIRVYEHPQFEQIRIEFEDGHAAMVAVSGLPGDGPFEPTAALASVGVTLPDAPFHDNPALGMGAEPGDSVDRWEWGNASARLRIDGLEFRVRLSVVNSQWRRAKLELINNQPLTEAQTAKIKLPRGAEPPASSR